MADWKVRFRASFNQVIVWLKDHGEGFHIDEYLWCFRHRETALAPKGAKITYRGGGHWVLAGYSQWDRFDKFPNQY